MIHVPANGFCRGTSRLTTSSWRHGSDDPPVSSTVARREPRNLAKGDPLVGQFARLGVVRLAIDAVRFGLAVVNSPRLFRKMAPDVIAMGFDPSTHLNQRAAQLGQRRRRGRYLTRATHSGRHYRLFDRGVAAMGTGNPAGRLLRFKPGAVTEPPLELMVP